MLVSAAPFFVFLVAVCLLYWAAAGSRRLQLAVLVAANLFFLARFSLIYLALPLAASADFLVACFSASRWQSTLACLWASSCFRSSPPDASPGSLL